MPKRPTSDLPVAPLPDVIRWWRSQHASGVVVEAPPAVDGSGFRVNHPGGTPPNLPQTLGEVDLAGRIRAAGGASLKEAGEFFGWEPAQVTKAAADFTADELRARGWTRDRLLHVAEGYDHIARITPANPSAAGRASQLRDIARLLD